MLNTLKVLRGGMVMSLNANVERLFTMPLSVCSSRTNDCHERQLSALALVNPKAASCVLPWLTDRVQSRH